MRRASSSSPILAALSVLLLAVAPNSALADCNASYNKDKTHAEKGKLDICRITLPDLIEVQTNWGMRPSWIDNERIAFLDNIVGNVWMLNVRTNQLVELTGRFSHSGFSRVHPMPNGDLLLVGPTNRGAPPRDPLQFNDEGRFEGQMFVLRKGPKGDYSVGELVGLGVRAWEGVAVSRRSNKIAWSDTNKPFEGGNVLETLYNYTFGRSNLWVGNIDYVNGVPRLSNKRIVKRKFGLVFYEPQDFRGSSDQELLFSVYGPGAEGTADTEVLSFFWRLSKKVPWYSWGYNEWEGISPDYKRAFIERDADAWALAGADFENLWLWDFASYKAVPFAEFDRADNFSIGNAVFSPNGKMIVMSADGSLSGESNPPGYALGIVVVNYEEWIRRGQPVLR
ncbi:hypothetical protein [Alcanivorax sp. 1008]|uniref:hypothetical protein n=1 Tax=Alcanivorax sp. 1008 TaxID=2816853 RepID=UPI001D6A8650|nr:hypothetical protein [Alcanivorax sp. 1008]MCC1496487.1 hypothetical protein [Alcanivorax sp. 1008]